MNASADHQHPAAAFRAAAPLLDALDTDYDTACEGSGFYALHSCANHSCNPNAVVEGDSSGEAVVLACRAIKAGEEVCISYIEEEAPYRERQAALADYGFACVCERCAEEAAASRRKKTGVKVGRGR